MSGLTTLLAFLVAIGILVFFHELGHFAVARAFGVQVLRFSVGFGRPLRVWRDRHGIEWAIAAIPLGGYVRMLDSREEAVAPEQKHLAFDQQRLSVRAAIVAAGPLANFALAIVFYAAVALIGVAEPLAILAEPPAGSPAAQAGLRAGDRIETIEGRAADTWPQVRWALLHALSDGKPHVRMTVKGEGEASRTVVLALPQIRFEPDEQDLAVTLGLRPVDVPIPPVIGEVAARSPAAAIGLQPGDEIVRLGEIVVTDWRQLAQWVREHPGEDTQIVWRRGDQMREAMVRLETVTDPSGATVGRLGVMAKRVSMPSRLVRYGPWEALQQGVRQTWEASALTLKMLGRMLVGEASWRNLSGPLTIADVAGQTAQMGIVPYLRFLAIVSVSLAILNLLPIPVLDGGHLLYYLIEAIRGRPLSEAAQALGQRIGLALLAVLMAVALFNDFLRLLQ